MLARRPPPAHAILAGDGLSVWSALACGPLRQATQWGRDWWNRLLPALSFRLSVVFVFGHCGLPAQEEANSAAARERDRLGHIEPFPWARDVARVALAERRAEHDLSARGSAAFRARLLEDDPWLLPFAEALPAGQQRLLAQLRSGCVGRLGGWRHERPEDCPVCGETGVLARGGAAVGHIFACPAPPWPERRGSLSVRSLVVNPAAAVAYAADFVAAAVAARTGG